MNDNGSKRPDEGKRAKTQEELMQEKRNRFNRNPDDFIEKDAVIMAAIQTSTGVGTIINPSTVDTLHIAMGKLADRYRIVLAVSAALRAKNPTIVRPDFKPPPLQG